MLPIIKIGPVSLYTYTLTGLLGMLFGVLVAVYADPKDKSLRSDIFYCSLYALIGGLAGGKILYLFTILPRLFENPSLIKAAIQSGMVFYGGLIGGILGGFLYVKQYKVDFYKMADNIILGLPVGHMFGRLGCFGAGCCYGKPYDGIFSVVYPKESLSAPPEIPLHPVPLYEVAYNAVLFLILFIIKRKSKNSKGLVLWIYLITYGIGRFYFETLRYDSERGMIGFLSTSQWISIVLVIFAVVGLIKTGSKGNTKLKEKSL